MTDSAPVAPWILFSEWYALAEKQEPRDPNAMSLATLGKDGMPSVRIVLLKGCDDKGFTFFTNRESRKGEHLKANPKAALCFHWKSLGRQIRVEGLVSLVGDKESDEYFSTRPRGSQIGAWASQQSRKLEDRGLLEQRVENIEQQYEGRDIERPPYWGGYRLTPVMIEFWEEKPYRLHDRIVYRRQSDKDPWTAERLYP